MKTKISWVPKVEIGLGLNRIIIKENILNNNTHTKKC